MGFVQMAFAGSQILGISNRTGKLQIKWGWNATFFWWWIGNCNWDPGPF